MNNKEVYNISNNFDSIIRNLESENMAQRDRGTLFELLTRAYFKNEPFYAQLYDEVWTLNEVPEEYNIPKKDTGVDLVAREKLTGKLVAIQCKYYSKETTIQKSHIDSFLNEIGKSYYASGIIITTTDKWSVNANDALIGRDKNIPRIGLSQLRNSEIDWSNFSIERPKEIVLKSSKTPRSHQIPAIETVIKRFENADRGKLIMAPGTGKTYTSMVIAEEMAEKKQGPFRVLYLVPSIQLLSQSLKGWSADSKYRENMDTFAVCSDRKVTKKTASNEFEDIAATDIGFPATTDYVKLLEYQQVIEAHEDVKPFTAVFSTYQSIDVIKEAQQEGFYEFDLIICDEAHRTTGATEQGKEESAFVKVHNNNNIKAKKRLYQTATPRVYGEDAIQKADEMSIVIADMDDKTIYGEEFHRIGFGEAVNKGVLSDYKVMVLAVEEDAVAKSLQRILSKNSESELEFDDVTKIIGCWNGLLKRKSESNIISSKPMKRAIAFAGTIKESEKITEMFMDVVDMYINASGDQTTPARVEIEHADGRMNALEKNEKIDWLKSEVPDETCRILSNARFLTEGVDVPDLDAVMFLKPRKSKIDIAQAVGRVMRKVEGKDYGYVILPIGVPAGADANTVLDNTEKYRVVWDVLNALRSIDERFDATINKLELNNKKPSQIQVIGVGGSPQEFGDDFEIESLQNEQLELGLDEEDFTELEKAIYGKIVKKVGNVRYWEDWSKDVAEIAQQHMTSIRVMIEEKDGEKFKAFQSFVKGLRYNINDAISEEQAIEMLAQHLITKPVFEALFESYSFVKDNPVSLSMESVLNVMDKNGLLKKQERLKDFYESVRIRAEGIDNLKSKQDIIIQLYDKFFKVGFKETTDRLGIVFTPTEVVDFIIHSVEDVLKKYFGKSLASRGVHVLDPFTGTGTFITRLLQSGLIPIDDLLRKYMQEIHANEIVLLSYYIAAVNIEETFHSLYEGDYIPFEGIVLTDTFDTTENKDSFIDELLVENNKRLKRQKEKPVFVIMGNPPYSVGQGNENENNKNVTHEILNKNIAETYVKEASSKSLRTYYDSYVKAFRWATDRIGEQGVIGFVTNNSFIDRPVMDGIRKSFEKEFNYLYIFNLRGAIRGRSKDLAEREGQNLFDIMTGVCISILIKDGSKNQDIFYKEFEDYLTRKEKIDLLCEWKSIENIDWEKIIPDQNSDWINQRDEDYQKFTPMYNENNVTDSIFMEKTSGIVTNRDSWVYNFSRDAVYENTKRLISNYNSERLRLTKEINKFELAEKNEKEIKWTRSLRRMLENDSEVIFSDETLVKSLYRPFTKKYLNYDRDIIESARGYWKGYFDVPNLGIMISGIGSRRGFSALALDSIPSMDIMEKGQVFLLNGISENNLFNENNISLISKSKCEKFGLSDLEFIYYIYAILHSNEYRNKYPNDLIKDFPRIPNLKNKMKFIQIGKQLFTLHLSYEECEPYEHVEIEYKSQTPDYKVKKMKHPKRGKIDTIIFNNDITIKNIPERAYEYVINGRSAIEWIINQYQTKTDKKTKITDDPNFYSDDEKYTLNLLLRIINVSIKTIDLINSLPPLEIEE